MHIYTHALHTALNAGTLLTDLMKHKELVCVISLSVCHGAFLPCSNMPGSADSQAELYYSTVSTLKSSVGNFICLIYCCLPAKSQSITLLLLQKREWHWSYMDMPTRSSWFLLWCLLPCNPQYGFPDCQSGDTVSANAGWSLLPLYSTTQQFRKSSSTMPEMHYMPRTKLQSTAVCVAFWRIALQAWLLYQDIHSLPRPLFSSALVQPSVQWLSSFNCSRSICAMIPMISLRVLQGCMVLHHHTSQV